MNFQKCAVITILKYLLFPYRMLLRICLWLQFTNSKRKIKVSNGTRSKLLNYMCYKNEPFIVLERCITCSRFERIAVRAGIFTDWIFPVQINDYRSTHIWQKLFTKPCSSFLNERWFKLGSAGIPTVLSTLLGVVHI